MNLGVIESRRNDDNRAVGLFKEAMSLKPGDAETALNLAISLKRLGRTAEGIDLLEAQDADDAKAPRIFSLLADLHAESGELDKAKMCHAKAATLDVQDPVHHFRLGTILLETGQYSDAIDALAKNAPAGSEGLVTMVKQAVSATNSAFDQVSKATKQAVEMAEANMSAAAKGNGRSAKKAA